MKTLAQQFHALTVDNLPQRRAPKPGAALLHSLALIPPGYCRTCWSYGRAIPLSETCPRCNTHTPAKTVSDQIQAARESQK